MPALAQVLGATSRLCPHPAHLRPSHIAATGCRSRPHGARMVSDGLRECGPQASNLRVGGSTPSGRASETRRLSAGFRFHGFFSHSQRVRSEGGPPGAGELTPGPPPARVDGALDTGRRLVSSNGPHVWRPLSLVSYATTADGFEIAYQVLGAGPL